MKYLVIVGDDFGFTPGVKQGALTSIQRGILQELSFMVESPGSLEAVDLVRQHHLEKQVGIHLTLNNLIKTGKYFHSADYEAMLTNESQKSLEEKVARELHEFEQLFGFSPSHINSHKNIHQHPKLRQVIADYALGHNTYVRRTERFKDKNIVQEVSSNAANEYFLSRGVKITDHIFEHIVDTYENAFTGFLHNLSTVEDNTITEIFFHPGEVDDLLTRYSSLTDGRERDVQLLTNTTFAEKIKALDFTITTFYKLSKKT